MAFLFPLESVRRLRRSLEKQEEQRLLAIAANLVKARAALERLDAERGEARRMALRAMESGASGALLNFELVCEAAYSAARQKIVQQIVDLERLRHAQIGIYRRARQQREILDNLREQRLAEYTLEAARREQQRMDELFLACRATAALQQDLPTR